MHIFLDGEHIMESLTVWAIKLDGGQVQRRNGNTMSEVFIIIDLFI